MGASLALPLLDAMVPAGKLGAATRSLMEPGATRLIAIEERPRGVQRLGPRYAPAR